MLLGRLHLGVIRLLAPKYKDILVLPTVSLGTTCLMMAAHHGYLEIVKFIIELCPEQPFTLDRNGATCVWLAAFGGKLDVVKYLVELHPALATQANTKGETPMTAALGQVKGDVADFLQSLVGEVTPV